MKSLTIEEAAIKINKGEKVIIKGLDGDSYIIDTYSKVRFNAFGEAKYYEFDPNETDFRATDLTVHKVDTEFKVTLKDGSTYSGQVNKSEMLRKLRGMFVDSSEIFHMPGVITKKKDLKAVTYKVIQDK